MGHKAGKTYIKKEKKWSIIITLITLVVAGLVVAVIELLPNNVSELGYTEQNGLGRAFMYPFVFTDGHEQLYVMNDKKEVVAVDNNISEALHDSYYGKVYYVRNTMLYEYSIKTNDRVALCDNVEKFSILGNRRGIVYTDTANKLMMYLFKGKETVKLSESEQETAPKYAVSNEGVVYNDGNVLKYCDFFGKIKIITENLNESKRFYVSSDSDNICFYEDNCLVVCSVTGKVIKKIENGQMIVSQEETSLIYPTTKELEENDGVPFRYFLSDISQVEAEANNSGRGEYKAGALKYLSGNSLKEIASDIYKVICYSEEDNFLLYTVLNGDKMDVYMTYKGGKPHKQISCDVDSDFIFDNRTYFLYYKDSKNMLWRYDIYDVHCKIVKIAENVGNIYSYHNKPYIAYTDIEQEYVYLVLEDKIERTDANYDIRLYGRNHESYMLCRYNPNGLMTLDYVFEDRLTRIANNVDANIYFDKDMEYAIYNEEQKMYLWHNGEIELIGEYEAVKAVDII
ncbi:MAG: hypothetical protein J6C24_05965 [Clostridia bacterium]|nr:hypothetical protein [Clostridia bacterium]